MTTNHQPDYDLTYVKFHTALTIYEWAVFIHNHGDLFPPSLVMRRYEQGKVVGCLCMTPDIAIQLKLMIEK